MRRKRRERRIHFLLAVTTNRPLGARRFGQAEDELERLLRREFGDPRPPAKLTPTAEEAA